MRSCDQQIGATHAHQRQGSGGGASSRPAASDFCHCSAKNSHFSAIRTKVRVFLEQCERTKLLRLESQLNN